MPEPRSLLILDNAFSKEQQDYIENFVINDQFPWFFQRDIAGAEYTANYENYFPSSGLTHVSYNYEKINSIYFKDEINFEKIVSDLAKAFSVELKEILRIKLNLTTPIPRYKSNNYCTPHTDIATPHWVLLYYINDCDGDTIFFENPTVGNQNPLKITYRVSPKKGTCVLFDGSIYHTSSNPINSPMRVNLNANVILL